MLRKYKRAGEYLQVYMSVTIYGIDIFVSSRALDAAKEVLNTEYIPLVEYEKDSIEEEIRTNSESKTGKKRRIKTWIIILIFMPGLLWIIYSIISGIFK